MVDAPRWTPSGTHWSSQASSQMVKGTRHAFDRTGSQLMQYHSFLGYVDLLGTTYQSPTIATGFGAYIAQPLLRNSVDESDGLLSEAQAEALIENCMKALFYRDARSLNKVRCLWCIIINFCWFLSKYQIAKVTAEGVAISEPKSAQTVWGFAEGIRGYGAQTQWSSLMLHLQ